MREMLIKPTGKELKSIQTYRKALKHYGIVDANVKYHKEDGYKCTIVTVEGYEYHYERSN